jgi:hypothetical protein
MDVAIAQSMSKQDLLDINLVRIYLKVCQISDIATALGDTIPESVWRCQQFQDRTSHLGYPRQAEPTVKQRRVWRKLLRTLLVPHAKLSRLHLLQALGPWIAPSTMKWKYSTWDENLYVQNVTHSISLGERCVAIHFAQHTTYADGCPITLYNVSRPDWFAAQVPTQATPVDVHGNNIVTTSYAQLQWPLISESAATFSHWRDRLPPAEKRLLTFVTYLHVDAELQLLSHLESLTSILYIGTDGGRKEADGSFAWLICSTSREKLVCNSGPVDGWCKCQSSYRSELMALSSAILFLDEFCAFHELSVQCTFQILSDSTGAISAIEHIRDLIPTRHYPDHADVVSTLKDAIHILAKSACQHVKSHQDDKKDFSDLPFPAQVNVLCDRMATRQMEDHREGEWASQQNFLPTRNQPVVISIMGQNIPSQYIKRLRDAITSDAHRTYFQQRYRWDDAVWSTIAWEPLYVIGRRTFQKPCFSNRSKLVHNWLNLGSQRAKFHTASADTAKQCPYCQNDENFVHLMTCIDPRAKKCRFEATTPLRKGLKGIPGGSTLLRLINLWTQTPTITPEAPAPTIAQQTAVTTAILSQTKIGWEHLFRGIISSDWGFITSDSDRTPPHMRRETAHIHLTTIIHKLQNYTLHIWEGRNLILHSNTAVSITIREAQVNLEISTLYAMRHTLSTRVQLYFQRPLETFLNAPYRHRQRWLIITRLATAQQQLPVTGQSQKKKKKKNKQIKQVNYVLHLSST